MSVSISVDAKNLLSVRVSGELTSSQWRDAQRSAAEKLDETSGELLMLVILENFQGWQRGDWDDASPQSVLDRRIVRMAIVGEKKWEDQVLMFVGKGLRRMQIEYFLPEALDAARTWLASGSRTATGKMQ